MVSFSEGILLKIYETVKVSPVSPVQIVCLVVVKTAHNVSDIVNIVKHSGFIDLWREIIHIVFMIIWLSKMICLNCCLSVSENFTTKEISNKLTEVMS